MDAGALNQERRERPRPRSKWSLAGPVLFFGMLAAIALLASRAVDFRSGDSLGYALGLWGGICMLAIATLYPVRKHFNFARGLGKMTWWMNLHILLGIAGPFLGMLHSRFDLRSDNAAACFWFMVIVALSGFVGRFLLIKASTDARDERQWLLSDQRLSAMAERWAIAPKGAQALAAAEADILALPGEGGWRAASSIWRGRRVARRAARAALHELDRALRARCAPRGEASAKRRAAMSFALDSLSCANRISAMEAWTTLFSLWHFAHVPFVCLLAATAALHVYAVHVY